MRAKLLAAGAAIVFSTSIASGGATIADTLKAFGFFGRWAIDCSEPASPSNNVRDARLSPTGDAVFAESLGGSGEPNVYVILRAQRTGDDTITLRIKLNGEAVQDLTMRRGRDRLRTISNRDIASGKYVVRNGVMLANKQKTPWLTRCDASTERSQRS